MVLRGSQQIYWLMKIEEYIKMKFFINQKADFFLPFFLIKLK